MADEIFFLKARDEIAKELLGFFYRIVRTKYKAQNIYLRTRMNFFFFLLKLLSRSDYIYYSEHNQHTRYSVITES